MAELEAEIFLLGNWKNFAELEESLSLPELQAMLEASREKELRQNKFMAAIQGIDLDEGNKPEADEVLAGIERRAKARISGATEEQVQRMTDSEAFGFDFEVEE